MGIGDVLNTITGRGGIGGEAQLAIVQNLMDAVNNESHKYLFNLQDLAKNAIGKRKDVDDSMMSAQNNLAAACSQYNTVGPMFGTSKDVTKPSVYDECKLVESSMREAVSVNDVSGLNGCYQYKSGASVPTEEDIEEVPCDEGFPNSLKCSAYMLEAGMRMRKTDGAFRRHCKNAKKLTITAGEYENML